MKEPATASEMGSCQLGWGQRAEEASVEPVLVAPALGRQRSSDCRLENKLHTQKTFSRTGAARDHRYSGT